MNGKPLALVSLFALAALAAAKPNAADLKFVPSIAYGNAFESTGGKVARGRSPHAALRGYGSMLVAMHGQAQKRLARIAQTEGLSLPQGLTPADRKLIVKFESLRGRAFDRTYKRAVLEHHRHALKGIEKEIREGRDPQILAYAREMLTLVREHIRALEAIPV